MGKFSSIREHLKFTTSIFDYIFIFLLAIVVSVGFYEFVSILYNQLTTGKVEFMQLLGSLFVVLIGLELLKISLSVERGSLNLYILAILDIVMIALARKIVLLSPKEMIDIYEYFAIGFIMLVILLIIKYMPEPFALTVKRRVVLSALIKDEVGALNKVTDVLKDLNINIVSMDVDPIGEGRSSLRGILELKSPVSKRKVEEKLKDLDVVIKVDIKDSRY